MDRVKLTPEQKARVDKGLFPTQKCDRCYGENSISIWNKMPLCPTCVETVRQHRREYKR